MEIFAKREKPGQTFVFIGVEKELVRCGCLRALGQ